MNGPAIATTVRGGTLDFDVECLRVGAEDADSTLASTDETAAGFLAHRGSCAVHVVGTDAVMASL